jgi:hypothetical protein
VPAHWGWISTISAEVARSHEARRIEQAIEGRTETSERLEVEGVVDPATATAFTDQPGHSQYLEVMREQGGAQAQPVAEIAHTVLAMGEPRDQPGARRLSERPQGDHRVRCHFQFCCGNHVTHPGRHSNIY